MIRLPAYKIIIQVFIALLIPAAYFFLMGGFSDTNIPPVVNKQFDPMAVIKTDFVSEVKMGKIRSKNLAAASHTDSINKQNVLLLTGSQRLVFKITGDTSLRRINPLYFRNVNGYPETDSNLTELIYASGGNYVDGKIPLKEGYIAGGIRLTGIPGVMLDSARAGYWQISPRMKIRRGDFSPGDIRPVAAVIVRNFHGDVIDSVIFKVRNFSDVTGKYDGTFKDEFKFEAELPGYGMMYSNNELFKGFGKDPNKFDVSIYWFGKVDLWFESITLENEMANALLHGNYDAFIGEFTDAVSFDRIINKLEQGNYSESNTLPLNYILNIMQPRLDETNY